MNYINFYTSNQPVRHGRVVYAQAGAALPTLENQEENSQDLDMQAQLMELVEGAKAGDPEALEALQAIAEAADNGDEQATAIMEMLNSLMGEEGAEEAAPTSQKRGGKAGYLKDIALKCGGKAKKTAKAEGGTRLRKGGCPCKVHRVGGRLVNMDCHGNIVR